MHNFENWSRINENESLNPNTITNIIREFVKLTYENMNERAAALKEVNHKLESWEFVNKEDITAHQQAIYDVNKKKIKAYGDVSILCMEILKSEDIKSALEKHSDPPAHLVKGTGKFFFGSKGDKIEDVEIVENIVSSIHQFFYLSVREWLQMIDIANMSSE